MFALGVSITIHAQTFKQSIPSLYSTITFHAINLGIMRVLKHKSFKIREHVCSRRIHNHSCINIQIKERVSSLYSTITFHAINLGIMRVLKHKTFKRREHVSSRNIHNHSCTNIQNKRESPFSIHNHNLPCHKFGHYEGTQT